MRVFIGILAPDELKENVRASLAGHLKQTERVSARWMMPWHWHVTLVSPFELDEVNTLASRLRLICRRVRPMTLSFDRISLGPHEKSPRLIWASGTAELELVELVQRLRSCVDAIGEPQSFKLHMTLARLMGPQNTHYTRPSFSIPIQWTCQVDQIQLIESISTPYGSKYQQISIHVLGSNGRY